MNLEAEKNNLLVLNSSKQLIDYIENNEYEKIDAIVISDFLENVENIIDPTLRDKVKKEADIIKEIFVDNRNNIDNSSLNRAMDSLVKLRREINLINLNRINNVQAQSVKDSLHLREIQYREDYYGKNNEEFLRSLTNHMGERVYSDEMISAMSYAEMEELVNLIMTRNLVDSNSVDVSNEDLDDKRPTGLDDESVDVDDDLEVLKRKIDDITGSEYIVSDEEEKTQETGNKVAEETKKDQEEMEEHIEKEFDIDLDELEEEYKEVEATIIGYIEASVSKLRRLQLHKERLLEQRAAIGNEPNKAALEKEYDEYIASTEKDISDIINPSKEEQQRIRAEKDSLYRLATSKIQKLEQYIRDLKAENRRLNFEYDEMTYNGIKDYRAWYKLKAKMDENNYKIRTMEGLIVKYENLKEKLRETEKVVTIDPEPKPSEPKPEPKPAIQMVNPKPEPKPAIQMVNPKPEPKPEPKPVIQMVDPKPEPKPEPRKDEVLTLDSIFYKVGGKEYISGRSGNRYLASKVELFNKVDLDFYGNSYKLVSIPKKIFGIIPRAIMKIGRLFVSQETKDNVDAVEERANKLTDREVEVILKEYQGTKQVARKYPKFVNQLVYARVQRYVNERVLKINMRISVLLQNLEYYYTLVENLKGRLEKSNDPEEIQNINNLLDSVYAKAALDVKELDMLQLKGAEFNNGTGLHALEEEMKATNTKMNVRGGRFAKTANWDPELRKRMSDLSIILKAGSDKEVFEAYYENQDLYIENTEEKRSFLNLGSKVSSGALDYRPFVETLNYGDDPFIGDLISTILLVTTVANIVHTISANAAREAALNDLNKQITDYNKVGAEQQAFINQFKSSEGTFEAGMENYMHEQVLGGENAAERFINSQHNHVLRGSSYVADDTAHHLHYAALEDANIQAVADLTSKFNSGLIPKEDVISGIADRIQHTAQQALYDYSTLEQFFKTYAANNPQFDMSSVIRPLEVLSNNPTATPDMMKQLSDLIAKANSLSTYQPIAQISTDLGKVSSFPAFATLGATVAKLGHEDVKSTGKKSNDWDREGKFAELIEQIKEGRLFTIEELDKEVDEIIRRGSL